MKKIVLVGTVVFAITVSGVSWNTHVSANPITLPLVTTVPVKEDLLQVLKLSSNEELYNALYEGNTLAEVANDHNVDVQNVINLQVAELTAQIELLYASGSITLQQYEEQKLEVRDIITKSVYGL